MLPAFFHAWYHDVTVKTQDPQRPATVLCIGAMLTTAKEGCYTTLWDLGVTMQELRCTDKDPKWRDWGSSTDFCHQAHSSLSTKTITIVLQSQTLVFRLRVWLCKSTVRKFLMMSQQQYHAWIQKHDGGHAMPYLLIKLLWWDNNPRDTLGSST